MHFQPGRGAVKFDGSLRKHCPPLGDSYLPMRLPLFTLLLATVLAPLSLRATETAVPRTPSLDPVWQAHLPASGERDYDREVEALIRSFEAATGKKLVPGLKGPDERL